jgi:hypothetical protein
MSSASSFCHRIDFIVDKCDNSHWRGEMISEMIKRNPLRRIESDIVWLEEGIVHHLSSRVAYLIVEPSL